MFFFIFPGAKHPITQVAQSMLDLCDAKLKEVGVNVLSCTTSFKAFTNSHINHETSLSVCVRVHVRVYTEGGQTGQARKSHQSVAWWWWSGGFLLHPRQHCDPENDGGSGCKSLLLCNLFLSPSLFFLSMLDVLRFHTEIMIPSLLCSHGHSTIQSTRSLCLIIIKWL